LLAYWLCRLVEADLVDIVGMLARWHLMGQDTARLAALKYWIASWMSDLRISSARK